MKKPLARFLGIAIALSSLQCADPFGLERQYGRVGLELHFSEQEMSLARVHNSSQELIHCAQRQDSYALTDSDLQQLSKPQQQQTLLAELQTKMPSCQGTLQYLLTTVDTAYKLQNSRRKILSSMASSEPISP